MVQWLRLCASTARRVRSILGGGTKIPHAMGYGQKKKKNIACFQALFKKIKKQTEASDSFWPGGLSRP